MMHRSCPAFLLHIIASHSAYGNKKTAPPLLLHGCSYLTHKLFKPKICQYRLKSRMPMEPVITIPALGDNYIFGSIVDYYFNGLTTDYRIYNRALNAAEIYALYNPKTRWDLYKPIAPTLWPLIFGGAPFSSAHANLKKKRFQHMLNR